ncbi:MAG: hypothetical protein JWQ90_1830 [Hydrocarboniphaga sp.]|uniref:hypothetical protein n=1 Tax=Hydrocarboniphaga sp. TaxID=2033016 RepID=UPI002629CDF2|nr:hypothetical protein [Hydrocarboniphaga sp.]MDB5969380.1 hypothetical protein [Hydrocarboniphaga sp.]
MPTLPAHRPQLPLDWSGQQAHAVLELLQILQDDLWRLYHQDIQDFLRHDRQPDRAAIDQDELLTLAINVLRDSAECLQMPSGLDLPPAAADLHRLAADWLQGLRNSRREIP